MAALSPRAQTLARLIQPRHITRNEFAKLRKSNALGSSLAELRREGVLVPVVHRTGDGKREPCYYYPPGFGAMLSSARPLLPELDPAVVDVVRSELARVGYQFPARRQ